MSLRRYVRGLLPLGAALALLPASAAVAAPDAVAERSEASSAYSSRGSHAVGFRRVAVRGAQGRRLDLRAWYPAAGAAGAEPRIRYAQRNKFNRQVLPVRYVTAPGAALRGGAPDREHGPYPLVLFSHGYAMSPILYSTLVEHYASRGFVVVAPEHNERLTNSLDGFWKAVIDRPVDITRSIDRAQKLTAAGGALEGMIDMTRVAVVGHSYGGFTALAAAGARFDLSAFNARCATLKPDDELRFFCDPLVPMAQGMAKRAGLTRVPQGLWPSAGDPRVTAAISLAGDAYLFDRRGLGAVKIPVLAMGGTVDVGTPYTWGAKLTYDAAGSIDKSLVAFPGAGHFIFADTCAGLPWTSRFSFGPVFCNDAVWGTKRPLTEVKHFSTAFLADTLLGDPAARAARLPGANRFAGTSYATTLTPTAAERP